MKSNKTPEPTLGISALRSPHPYLAAAIVFILAFIVAVTIVWRSEQNRLQLERARVSDVAGDYAHTIQANIERALSAAYSLAALVRQGKGSIPDFDAVAHEMLRFYPGAASLQLAPRGIVRQIAPLAGNEAALGHNLLKDPARTKEAFLARDTGKLTLAGPFTLLQGGVGAVGRLPVYIGNGKGKAAFWGFTCVLVRFPDVLDPARLSNLEKRGFRYELWRIHPDTGKRQVIAASSSDSLDKPVDRLLELPNETWTLSIVPTAGWSDPVSLILNIALGLLFCLLLSAFTLFLLITRSKSRQIAEANRLLETLSITDPLTGLANRRCFDEALAKEYARSVRSGDNLSMLMLDIDHFKEFNDSYGHVSGDDCLRQISQVIAESAVRASDITARYGGEEFTCILPETDRYGAAAIAEKIRLGIMNLAIPHSSSATAKCVTASIGVGTIRCTDDKPASDLIVLADKMLYKAKAGGRNRVETGAFIGKQQPDKDRRNDFVQLVWKDIFCSGNHQIDTQHRELFRISNELLTAILSARPTVELSIIATRLLDHIAQHFRDEETILESANYPGLKLHAEEHARLYKMGQDLVKTLPEESLPVGDIFKFLVYDVVFHHLLDSDRKFFPLICDGSIDKIECVCEN